MFNKKLLMIYILFGMLFMFTDCSKSGNPAPAPVTPPTITDPGTPGGSTNEVDFWLTRPDQSALLQLQPGVLSFGTLTNSNPNITVDSTTSYQSIDGFGYTLTGSSAQLINNMGIAEKAALLNELFGTASGQIGVSYLRISIGASDLSPSVFSYDDLPAGNTDPTLASFSLSQDLTHLVPVIKAILLINPNIKILGSPWSAPVWMKDNGLSKGGTLLTTYYGTYANYFVKYIQAMQAQGIRIDAVTLQNEPQNPDNNPSMVFSAAQEATFVKNNLGPAFQTAGLTTKIIVWDHNCDNSNYPITVLNDAAAYPFIDGSAFHLYAGDISAMSTVHNNYPTKNLYFTEQFTSSNGNFNGDLQWHLKNVVIGSMRNWSKNALEWNLANDPAFGPHTPGGCTECKGALTLNGNNVTRNVAYYIIAHASKFVPAGSVRIASNVTSSLQNVAFKTPAGKKVLIVLNDASSNQVFNINFKGKWITTALGAGSVGTYIW
jgi:glucosylceramidase